jgi:hypothetical protein
MDIMVSDVFFEIHADNPREGPGDFNSTKRAFLAMKNLPGKPKILDIGCGPGGGSQRILGRGLPRYAQHCRESGDYCQRRLLPA